MSAVLASMDGQALEASVGVLVMQLPVLRNYGESDGLKLIKEKGWREATIETDSKVAMKLINK